MKQVNMSACSLYLCMHFSSPEPKAHIGGTRACSRTNARVPQYTHSNLNISEASRLIKIISSGASFGWEKAALGFGQI